MTTIQLYDATLRDGMQGEGMSPTSRRGVRGQADEGLAVLAGSFAPVCTIVGKTCGLHVEKVVRVRLDTSGGQDVRGAIGVDENVIAASREAPVDSLERAMPPVGAGR